MYSVVLMMAMTTAPETPQFFFHCNPCYSSCYGCWGSCYGCWGSCHGCWGSCYGCYGGYWTTNSCYGYGIYGGASYTWPYPYYGGCGGCYGYSTPMAPIQITPKVEEKLGAPKKTTFAPDQARVIVHLPADAKLFANGQPTNLASAERQFFTPSLATGHDYQYTMKVEYIRDGKTITDSQVVKVRAGTVASVDFVDQAASTVAVIPVDRSNAELVASKVTVIAPANAKIFVGNTQELPAGAKEFTTPKLAKGKEYTYHFRAELTKNGAKQTQTQRVAFKAGDAVEVDFSDMNNPRTASTK
jgi:uncharacterized protein (TIGR03000 family)